MIDPDLEAASSKQEIEISPEDREYLIPSRYIHMYVSFPPRTKYTFWFPEGSDD